MNVTFSVRLPVDSSSVSFARGLCRSALEHLDVDALVVDDIALALTEACANVVRHAGSRDDYEVQVDLDPDRCRISVLDEGAGFDPAATRADPGESILECGRGLFLMRALMDELHFGEGPQGRHQVVLEKRLATTALPHG